MREHLAKWKPVVLVVIPYRLVGAWQRPLAFIDPRHAPKLLLELIPSKEIREQSIRHNKLAKEKRPEERRVET